MSSELYSVMVNGQVYEVDEQTLGQWILERRILPGDQVKKGQLNWIPAENVPVLRNYFTQANMLPPPASGYQQPQNPAAYGQPQVYNPPQGYQQPYQPQAPYGQMQSYNPAYVQQGHPGNTSVERPGAVGLVEALLWFLFCLPIGYVRWGQTGKMFLWMLITIFTGGLGVFPCMVDYFMCYQAQRQRELRSMEFFPRS
jgi:hypothetical protein